MVEHAEALRHRVIARLSHQDAIRFPEIRLTDDTSQRREVAEGTRIEQDGQMPGRRIAALPFLDATIELFPDDGHRQLTGEGGRRSRHNGRITGHRIGFHTDDQTACLEVPTKRGKLLLGRVDHDMQVAGNNANNCLVAGCSLLNAEVGEQVVDVVVVTMGMMATEATLGERFVRLEIDRAVVHAIGMLVHPGASDVVLAGAQRRLVQARFLECLDDRIFDRLRQQHCLRIEDSANCLADLTSLLASAER